MSQVTVDEVATFMNTTFDAGQAAQVQMIVDQVEAYISRTVGITFGVQSNKTTTLVADGRGLIELPLAPVIDVTEVKYLDGSDYRDGWGYNEAGVVYGITPGMAVRVTWSYGYAEMPADLKGVALGMASRQTYNPVGVRQKTVGSESITYASASDAGAIQPSTVEREILDSYRSTERSWRLILGQFPADDTDRLPTL